MSALTQAWLCAALLALLGCIEAIEDDEIVSAVAYGITLVLSLTSAALAERHARIEGEAD